MAAASDDLIVVEESEDEETEERVDVPVTACAIRKLFPPSTVLNTIQFLPDCAASICDYLNAPFPFPALSMVFVDQAYTKARTSPWLALYGLLGHVSR